MLADVEEEFHDPRLAAANLVIELVKVRTTDCRNLVLGTASTILRGHVPPSRQPCQRQFLRQVPRKPPGDPQPRHEGRCVSAASMQMQCMCAGALRLVSCLRRLLLDKPEFHVLPAWLAGWGG